MVKNNRSKLVRDFDYGIIMGENREKYDLPVYSELAYDENSNLIFENYAKLEQYLDREFIPKVIKTKKYRNEQTGYVEYYSSIQLNQIIGLKLSEQEVKYTIEYLQARDIRVAGINSTLDSNFENYEYISTYKMQHLPKTLKWEDQKKLFEEFEKTSDEQIRQRIIEANLRLVPFITYKFAYTYHIDINELNSYGYEALINAISNFDLSMEFQFSSYAYRCIQTYIISYLPTILGFKNPDVYKNYNSALDKTEYFYEKNGVDNEISMLEIIDFMQEENKYGKVKAKNASVETYLANTIGIDELSQSNEYVDDYTIHRRILLFDSHEKLMGEINSLLTNLEKFVIVERYGLKSREPKTLDAMSKMMNIRKDDVRQIEKKALQKMSYPKTTRKLHDLLEEFDIYNYDESIQFKKM